MNAKDRQEFTELIRKLDKILEVLSGDAMGSYPGLIKQQQADEDFKSKTGKKLDSIIHNQENQIRINHEQLLINEEVKRKLEEYDDFFLIFKKLTKVKRVTIVWLIALLSALGALLYEVQHYIKNLTIKLPW